MRTGARDEERREQRDFLKAVYADYNPKRHDVYVIRWNREQEEKAMQQYLQRRGVK